MKNRIKDILASAILAAALVLVLQLAKVTDAIAQVVNRQPTPTIFVDYTGTNWVACERQRRPGSAQGRDDLHRRQHEHCPDDLFKLKFVNGMYSGAVPFTD